MNLDDRAFRRELVLAVMTVRHRMLRLGLKLRRARGRSAA